MRLPGSAKDLEARRRRALKLVDVGHSLNEVGRRLGCAPSSVMRWRNARLRDGEDGLRVKLASGRPPKLSTKDLRKLVRLLLKGAIARGYQTELWTTPRIAEVVEEEFGVHYHRAHVSRLLRRLGWSYQKPERRAVERDEKAIERFRKRDWPRVKKTLRGWVPTSSS